MRRFFFLLLAMFLSGVSAQAMADEKRTVYPIPADVETIDGIVRAFFEVISTPAGDRPDQARDASLHAPGAQIRLSRQKQGVGPELSILTLEQLYEQFGGPRPKNHYEREIHRVTQRFGNIAQVWSTYETSDAPAGTPIDRGISSIHLYFDGKRWWITGWLDEAEYPGNPIPSEFLPRSSR